MLGIEGDGQVWILGKCLTGPCDSDEALFRFTGDGFETMRLIPLPNTDSFEARRISRDGQYIVGSSRGDGFEEPTLWSRRESLVPKSLGKILESCCTAEPQDVASTTAGPIIVGYYGFGTFLWREGTGYQAWMTNSGFWPIRRAYVISADGTRWAGQQFSPLGSNLVSLPFAGTEMTLEMLKTKAGSSANAFSISPNGQHIVGLLDQQPVIWTKKKVEFLSVGKGSAALLAVTDNGYAGGRGAGGGVIYDSRGRKLELFDNWWANNYPLVPLPAHVTVVNDLYEHAGKLYCLIQLEDPARYYRTSALAIAPLKGAGD